MVTLLCRTAGQRLPWRFRAAVRLALGLLHCSAMSIRRCASDLAALHAAPCVCVVCSRPTCRAPPSLSLPLLLLLSISTVCWEKCVTKKNQPELSIGETACIDRCVLKHLATSTKVAEVFAVHMQQGQAAQAPPQ